MKFIHTADLHLGSSFASASFDKDIAKIRREELFTSFEKMIRDCKKLDVDLLLIAGDLFEESLIKASDVKRVIDVFESIKDIHIVICAGNHDYINDKSYYNLMDFPDNVTIFNQDGLNSVYFDEINTWVYGFSFFKNTYGSDFITFPKLDKSKNNILLLHCDVLNSNSNYLPIKKEKLVNSGFDYVALGHIHKSLRISNNIFYPGSLEPLDFSENGVHGYVFGTLGKAKDENVLIRGAKREFKIIEIDITGFRSLDGICNLIEEKCRNEKNRNLYRIVLKGVKSSLIDIRDVENKLTDKFFYIEFKDNTIMDYDLKKLQRENENNVLGLYIENFLRSNDSVDIKALYYGLEALLGKGGGR